MQTKNLYQEIIFHAQPQEVYDCYMDEEKHADITGSEAEIEPVAGGTFSAYDGYATGMIKELVPGQLIKHTWRAEEEDWAYDYYSDITIELEKHPEGTLLKFTQKGVPETGYDDIAQGWVDYYWEPMKEYFKVIH